MSLNKLVATNIKRIRKSKKLKQKDMAKRLNLCQEMGFHIEKGKRILSLDDLVTIADFLGVRVNDLLVEDKQEERSNRYGY